MPNEVAVRLSATNALHKAFNDYPDAMMFHVKRLHLRIAKRAAGKR